MGRNSTRIRPIAHSLITQLHLTIQDLGPGPVGVVSAKLIWQTFGLAISLKLDKMSPATLGEIIAGGREYLGYQQKERGKTSMYEVHFGKYVGEQDGGMKMLYTLATTALVAEITDILLEMLISNACRDCGYQLVNGRCKNCQDARSGWEEDDFDPAVHIRSS